MSLQKSSHNSKVPPWGARDQRPEIARARVARTLGHLGDERAIVPLLGLSAIDPYHYQKPSGGGGASLFPALVTAWLYRAFPESPSPDPFRPSPAREALGSFGSKAIEPVIQELHNENQTVRTMAAQFLGEQHDRRAVEPLLEMLASDSWPDRAAAATALGELDDSRTIEPLEQALTDEAKAVRISAERSLQRLRDRDLEP